MKFVYILQSECELIRIKSASCNLKYRISTGNKPHLIVIQKITIVNNCIPVIICDNWELIFFIVLL